MRRYFVHLAVASAVITALGLAPANSAAAGPVSDVWLVAKVKAALFKAPGLHALAIDVDARGDLVTLHGAVSREAERARASSAALDIDGVRAVRNLLAVIPEPARAEARAADARLERRLEVALSTDPALSESRLRVKSVHGGIVLLAGEASSPGAHRRALRVAGGVKGARRVASEIRSPDAVADLALWERGGLTERRDSASGLALTDAWITTKAKLRLKSELGLSLRDVHVETVEGNVTVLGSVPSRLVRDEAEEQLLQIDGVRRVTNQLRVVPNT
jgi:osmotically-inducible protein OsmY